MHRGPGEGPAKVLPRVRPNIFIKRRPGRRSAGIRIAARSLRYLAIAALVLELLYAIAANLLLRLGGVKRMFASTDSVKVDHASGWTVWPGIVHVSDLRVTI